MLDDPDPRHAGPMMTFHGIPFRAIPDSGTITKYFALVRSSEVASQPVDGTFCFVEPFPSELATGLKESPATAANAMAARRETMWPV